MCLRTLEKQPAIAEEDIVCYKTMFAMCSTQPVNMERHPSYNPDHLLSTWKFHRYEWGKVEEVDDMPLKPDPSGHDCVWRIVEKGFHSWKRFQDAMRDCMRSQAMVIAKCVIPKGSKYFKGNTYGLAGLCEDDEYMEYCSDHIKVVAWRLPEYCPDHIKVAIRKRPSENEGWITVEDAERLKDPDCPAA